MARDREVLPLESVTSRLSRENVNADDRVSALTGEDASAFFPAEGEDYPVGSGARRAADQEGATQGTADGLNGHPDHRQGAGTEHVPDVTGHDQDNDLDNDGTPDA